MDITEEPFQLSALDKEDWSETLNMFIVSPRKPRIQGRRSMQLLHRTQNPESVSESIPITKIHHNNQSTIATILHHGILGNNIDYTIHYCAIVYMCTYMYQTRQHTLNTTNGMHNVLINSPLCHRYGVHRVSNNVVRNSLPK
jgi:hypothetical protein